MTDWLPWGLVLMAGAGGSLAHLMWTLGRTPAGNAPALRESRQVLGVAAAACAALFLLYVLFVLLVPGGL